MKPFSRLLVTVAGLLIVTNAAMASTMTFATFADPSGSAANPLFRMDDQYSKISGEYLGTGLTLQIPFTGEEFQDVTFVMDEISADLYGFTDPGQIDFFDGGDLLLTITFQSARLTEFGFGARNKSTDPDNVDIIYTGFSPSFNLTDEAFAFSFSNFDEVTTPGWITTTASFTSSAIPEPATAVFLGLGCLPMLRRRRTVVG